MEEPRYMKRKILAGAIDVDEEENTIIVHYEVEATVLGDLGEAMQMERKAHQKRIRLKSLNQHSNVARLAEDIVDKCSLIHPSKLPLVERLVFHLQQRQIQRDATAERSSSGGRRRRRERGDRDRDRERDRAAAEEHEDRVHAMPKVEAKMDDVEDYLEKLYEDAMGDKIEGTAMLLQLAHFAGNLEDMVSNERLMGALSRVLGDFYRKSSELAFNIMRIFWSFSNFIQMHQILGNYRVGAMTMNVLDWELKKHEHRVAELQEARRKREEEKTAFDESKGERQAREERERRANRAFVLKQDRLLHVCISVLQNLAEEVAVERKMVKRKLIQHLAQVLTRNNVDLLQLTCSFLKRLSIREENKDEMQALDVVTKVVRFIPCGSEPLMRMGLRLLFNLAFDGDAREAMVSNSLIPKLVELLKQPPFRQLTLRLLYQLSVDDRYRSMFTFSDAIPITMQLVIRFPKERIAPELVALAINLSLNARAAEMMCTRDYVGALVQRLLNTRDSLLAKVVRNLSQWTRNVQTQVKKQRAEVRDQRRAERRAAAEASGEGGKKKKKKRGGGESEGKGGGGGKYDESDESDESESESDLETDDDLDDDFGVRYEQAGLWAPFVNSLVELAVGTDNHDLLVEVLGTLGNLTPEDLPREQGWAQLAEEHNILAFLHRLLVPGMSQDDVVLEIVILLGTIAMDPEAAPLIASSRLIMTFQLLLHDKAEDAEILLQLLHTFYRLLLQRETRDEIMYGAQQVVSFVTSGCLGARNPAVRRAAIQLLDVVVDQDREGNVAETVRRRKFELHNADWLDMANADDAAAADDFDDDDDDDDDRKWGAAAGYDSPGDSPGAHSYDDSHDEDGRIAEWSRRHGTNVAMDMDMLGVDGGQAGSWDGGADGPAGHYDDGGVNRYWEEEGGVYR